MTDVPGLAVRLVALTELAKRVGQAKDATKQELTAALDPGDRKVARLTSGQEVGTVTYTRRRATASVSNLRALTEWVTANYPHEIEQQIKPAFVYAILEASKRAGEPICPDGTAEVPGVVVGHSEPYLTAKPTNVVALVDAIRASRDLALEGGE